MRHLPAARRLGGLDLPDDRPFIIAGPCVIESEDHALWLAGEIGKLVEGAGLPFVFKASFDKANRTSIDSYRGPGLEEGLSILAKVKRAHNVPLLTDIHTPEQAAPAAKVVDVLQVPAFLARQTDLIVAAAETGRVVNIKKGQFMAPWDIVHSVDKARAAGCDKVWLTERGVSFGYNTLVSDFKALEVMRGFGCPVIYDATHSVQQPSAAGGKTGGQREFLEPLLRAAVAVGVDGVFIEVHEQPDKALSDGPNMLPLERLAAVLDQIIAIDKARRSVAG